MAAGGKETPRQKMIGLMYLILTAMLALNVDSAVLEKFLFFNNSLERSIDKSKNENTESLNAIKTQVSEMGDREKDLAVLQTATEIRQRTTALVKELEELGDKFVEITGGSDESGKPKNLTDREAIASHMLGKRGKELQENLNNYSAFLAEKTGGEFSNIALDGKDDPVFKNDPDQRGKSFASLYFEESPMVASLASVSQLATEVLSRETRALDILKGKVGAEDVSFDNIKVMVNPESRVVAAGTKYKADVFLAASSSGITPTMKAKGTDLEVNGGFGKLEFTARPSKRYNKDGLSAETFKAEISMAVNGGETKTYTEEITYFVAKPYRQISSASVQALYYNCGNKLNIQVPSLGSSYNPSFRVTGASAIEGDTKGEVMVIPNSRKVVLTTSSSGIELGKDTFNVRPIPKPDVTVLSKGKEINMKVGVSAPGPRTLQIRAIPDEGFKEFLPDDARYRVAEAEVTLARGSRPVKRMKVTNGNADLSQFASLAKKGDRIVIEVTKVQRRNFRNEVEDVNMANSIFQIPLN
ncbi:gliding motility protein GldM [Xanthovirga aplysinae]|uniref:type IX secretion system motor protein PorM/GldM n=1 Tax=Xanthovirga aplysinae TaxID=2529853 RepID=UPI0012BB6F77|nr:gliding motility protein GldM [Xanthovirga aplysinae]MTI33325.1 gliding motility protein GldM [Xanthovirga aplysinae]